MQGMEKNREKWLQGLARTRKSTFGKIATFFGASEISETTWEELESLFIQSDIGVPTSLDIIEQARGLTSRKPQEQEDENQAGDNFELSQDKCRKILETLN